MLEFANELAKVLPSDLPQRDAVIVKAARHLELIAEANQHFNLTRIAAPREAAIKHVLDSLLPWRLFAGASHILDAGSGAGFPGIPLATVLADQRFILAESIQKRARFLDHAADALELHNVEVRAERAEELLRRCRIDIITARAVAPVLRVLQLFAPAIRSGVRALLYKGPDAEAEIADAASEARRLKIHLRVLERFELPDSLGSRVMIEMSHGSGRR